MKDKDDCAAEDFTLNVNEVATSLMKFNNEWNLCKGILPGIELENTFNLAIASR